MTRMPIVYKAPLGLPFFWRDEASGELNDAVMAYLNNRIEGQTVTDAQIVLVRDYLAHYIGAPCWDDSGFEMEMAHLRSTVRELDSATEIQEWIRQCLDIGMDPL